MEQIELVEILTNIIVYGKTTIENITDFAKNSK